MSHQCRLTVCVCLCYFIPVCQFSCLRHLTFSKSAQQILSGFIPEWLAFIRNFVIFETFSSTGLNMFLFHTRSSLSLSVRFCHRVFSYFLLFLLSLYSFEKSPLQGTSYQALYFVIILSPTFHTQKIQSEVHDWLGQISRFPCKNCNFAPVS